MLLRSRLKDKSLIRELGGESRYKLRRKGYTLNIELISGGWKRGVLEKQM